MVKGIIRSRTLWGLLLLFLALLLLPGLIPEFYVYITGVMFVTGLLAMSLNMVIGHGGMYQFHHGVFYGVGAYTSALILVKTALPSWVAFAAGPLAATILGLLIGLFCVRLSKLYFGMLQISLGSLVWAVAFRWYSFTGGDDGIHGIATPEFLATTVNTYYFIFGVVCISLILLYVILKSAFGMTLRAIRDNPQRCEAIGVNVRRHQLLGIVIATFFAGVAGVLFVVLEHSVFPDLLLWVFSLELFIMCVLGGWFTFAGPMVGACLVIGLRTFACMYTDYWTMILGVILILVLFCLPEGLLGHILNRYAALATGSSGKGLQ